MREDVQVVEFADPGPLREQLIAAIRSGRKTATSSLVRQYEVAGEPLPVAGQRGVVVDSVGQPQFTIRTVDVQIVPLCEVPLVHAVAEGEGYESVDDWRTGHLVFWQSDELRAALGAGFVIGDDTPVVLERFSVVR